MSSLGAVLVTGLFAGGVSCAAVQGGLLTGLVARQRPKSAAAGAARLGGGSVRQRQGIVGKPSLSAGVRLGDDLAPVGGFLVGKLISHTLLGAALGGLGSLAQLSVSARAYAQLAAGAVVIVFGLAQLGVPGFREITVQLPASWGRLVRGQARSTSALAPALLGLATVLIPCGVTLSVAALAVASGSAWSGAATMAVFVIGASPLFALLGYAARKAAVAWRGKLAVATGLVVMAMGLYTFNGGLELAGSSLAASRLTEMLASNTEPAKSAHGEAAPVSVKDGRQKVIVTARTGAYEPAKLTIRAGLPTTLIVRSEAVRGCVRSFVIPSRDIEEILPADGDTRIDLGSLRPGRLDYSCGMGMYTGVLTIKE